MATFQNQATLIFGSSRINSNTTEGEIVDAVTVTKSAVSAGYGEGDAVAYAIGIVNGGTAALTSLTLTDDLGAYTAADGTLAVPLEYVEDSLRYYLNGELLPTPTVVAGDTLTVSGISVPAGEGAVLVYEARTNGKAPLAIGSAITNTATLTGTPVADLTATATVPVREEPRLSITKTASPDTLTGGGEITYGFIIQNTGNAPVVATDNLTVTDLFSPILSGITVTLDGATLTEGIGYTYDEASGSFTTLPGAITVPAASYSTLPDGTVTVTPGVTVLRVAGTI